MSEALIILTPQEKGALKNVAKAALGAGLVAGVFVLGRHLYNNWRQTRAHNSSVYEGDPNTFAKQLKMAFENDMPWGWGTDVKEVMRVFEELPSKSMYKKVQNSYKTLYDGNLNADLEDELTSDEYNQVIRILSLKK